MIRYLSLFFLCLGMNAVHAYAGFGVCNHGKETLPSVICDGPTVLKQTQIKGDLKIAGTLQAEGISTTNMNIKGSAQITDAEVRGAVNVIGDLTADNVTFKKGIAVESDKIMLNHTTVNGLVIVTSKNTTPYVQVQCGSDIKGSVMFEGKPGVVQVTQDSVLRGKIVNGSTIFVKRDCQ